jgi:hypothetical protein
MNLMIYFQYKQHQEVNMVVKIDDTKQVESLFCNWQETLIWSCLQNVMGSIYADSLENPLSAMAVIGDFCFFAGKPNRELVLYKPEEYGKNFIIMVPHNDGWADLIENGYGDCKKYHPLCDKKRTECV